MHKAVVAGAITAIWATAAATSLLVAAKTAVGPVVFVVSRREAHGIHLGDMAGVVVSATWALFGTVGLLRLARRPPH